MCVLTVCIYICANEARTANNVHAACIANVGVPPFRGSRAALAESFNNITADNSVPQRMQLWSSIKTAFLNYNARGQVCALFLEVCKMP